MVKGRQLHLIGSQSGDARAGLWHTDTVNGFPLQDFLSSDGLLMDVCLTDFVCLCLNDDVLPNKLQSIIGTVTGSITRLL